MRLDSLLSGQTNEVDSAGDIASAEVATVPDRSVESCGLHPIIQNPDLLTECVVDGELDVLPGGEAVPDRSGGIEWVG